MSVLAIAPETFDRDAWDYTHLPPFAQPPADLTPEVALGQARGVIEHAIANHPRSLQRTIGPSEIGTPCDHCLAAKLAGWEQTDEGVRWLPFVGTSVHAMLERIFVDHETARNAPHTTGRRWFTEARVMVGTIAGREVWGSTDLLDTAACMTVDWKIVGAATLRNAHVGPSVTYQVQADLYAKGWNDAGVCVDTVAICYLPRGSVSLEDAVWWHAPHDRDRAEAALARANRVAANLTALESISIGARDAWITALPREGHCFDCARYPDRPDGAWPPTHHDPQDAFADLLA